MIASGSQIRCDRAGLGWSQAELAGRAGIHAKAVAETMSKLTPKQGCFVKEYLQDLNATQAAIRAGYSPRTAKQMGTENLAKPVLAAAIQKAMAERAKRTEIDADYVLNSIRETMERCKQAEPVRYQNGDPVMIDTPDGEIVPAYKFDSTAVLKGAELLGRHLAMFTDKAVVDLNHGLQEMDDDALDAHARQLADRLGAKLPEQLITPTKVR
jgi:phage terminase small subunit